MHPWPPESRGPAIVSCGNSEICLFFRPYRELAGSLEGTKTRKIRSPGSKLGCAEAQNPTPSRCTRTRTRRTGSTGRARQTRWVPSAHRGLRVECRCRTERRAGGGLCQRARDPRGLSGASESVSQRAPAASISGREAATVLGPVRWQVRWRASPVSDRCVHALALGPST